MFSAGRLDRLRRSVALRLSLWFAGLFAVGFVVIFALLYFLLGRQLELRESEALRLRLQQYADIYEARGVTGLRSRINQDGEAPHVRSLFVRLVGPRGNVVWARVPSDWVDQDARRVAVPNGWGGWNVRRMYTVRVPRDQQKDLAVVSALLSDGLLLQVGRSTDNRATLLEPLRRTFLWVGSAVILVGFGIAVVAARRATRPLHSVVETARRIISTGALDARVPVPSRADDMAELVRHFNTVLDKNAALLRAMREALDNVAHDLRTPLTSLRGTAELALTQTDDATARDALANCVERADEVLQLLRALMEISEAEAGVLRLEKSDGDLNAIARAASDLYADVAAAKSIELKTETGGGAVPIYADLTRIRQAVANLVDNAIKYTPDGGRVALRTTIADGWAVLEIEDSGPGVPASEQPRIWERLYRGDQSRSESGLGLGLSVVRAVVEAHGGRVAMHNAPAGGAIFELRLPLKPAT